EFVSRVSLRTMVTATDIANMALFLASPAGQHISGQALSVCGNVESLA
ncbi:MAG: SDR family oxidoreductase, partial [Burkholderiales bacterium]|nr:SDR family oxidoreductase [Burkholderiales bacterium]